MSKIKTTATGHRRIRGAQYVHVPCKSLDSHTNPEFVHYLRLYALVPGQPPRLADQGLPDKIPVWERKYGSTLQVENPYPLLD